MIARLPQTSTHSYVPAALHARAEPYGCYAVVPTLHFRKIRGGDRKTGHDPLPACAAGRHERARARIASDPIGRVGECTSKTMSTSSSLIRHRNIRTSAGSQEQKRNRTAEQVLRNARPCHLRGRSMPRLRRSTARRGIGRSEAKGAVADDQGKAARPGVHRRACLVPTGGERRAWYERACV